MENKTGIIYGKDEHLLDETNFADAPLGEKFFSSFCGYSASASASYFYDKETAEHYSNGDTIYEEISQMNKQVMKRVKIVKEKYRANCNINSLADWCNSQIWQGDRFELEFIYAGEEICSLKSLEHNGSFGKSIRVSLNILAAGFSKI